MKEVAVPAALVAEMKSHARQTYPDECCGFLVGPSSERETGGRRIVLALERAQNEYDGERRRRFLIRPEELRETERRLENFGRTVVGFYHSHPDHPARPSQFDQDHAWPWYSYLVLSATATEVPALAAFELDPESAVFREVTLSVLEIRPSTSPVVGG